MESAEDFAFECILQPSILDERLLNKSPKDPEVIDWAIKVLKELLGQLSAVTKSHVTANGEGQYRSKDHGSLKKKAYIQLMVRKNISFFLEKNTNLEILFKNIYRFSGSKNCSISFMGYIRTQRFPSFTITSVRNLYNSYRHRGRNN